MAKIDGRLLAVEDISLGGLRLSGVLGDNTRPIPLVLYPRDGDTLLINEGVPASGKLVGRYGHSTGVKFVSTTLPLMKLVLRQVARALGVEPYLLK